MIFLSEQDRMAILAAALGAVSFTLVVMLCKLCPWCPLHRWCPLRAKYRQEEEEELEKAKKRAEYQELICYGPSIDVPMVKASLLNDQSANDSRTGSVKSAGSAKRPPALVVSGPHRGSYQSNISVASGTSNSPLGTPSKLMSFFDYTTTEDESKVCELEVSLKFDSEQEKLGIHVKCGRNFPSSIYGTPNDCFLRILLVRDLKKGWGRRKSSMSLQDLTNSENVYDSCEFATQLIRRNLNPVFNEYFAAELKEKDKKYSVLKLAICHIDRFGRHSVAAESHKNLARLDLKETKDFVVQMKENRPELGEMQLSLSYLPTAERLSLVVIKLTHLRSPPGFSSSEHLNPYVKFALLHRGKTLEKHKTTVKCGSHSPEFSEETITFDLPNSEIDRTTLILTVAHQESDRDSQESGHDTSGSSGDRSVSGHSSRRLHSPKQGAKARRRSAGNALEIAKSTEGNLPP